MTAAGQFLRAYASRDVERMGDELIAAVGVCDRDVYTFIYALAAIADTALQESSKVLDSEPSRVREAVVAMATYYFSKGTCA